MAYTQRYDSVMLTGHRIFFKEFELSGSKFRIDALRKFIDGGYDQVQLKADPNNPHDRYAIRVEYTPKSRFLPKSPVLLGYIPAEMAKLIHELDCFDMLAPKLNEAWIGDHGGAIVRIELTGPDDQFANLAAQKKKILSARRAAKLISCPSCTSKISRLAEECPKCGHPLSEDDFIDDKYDKHLETSAKQARKLKVLEKKLIISAIAFLVIPVASATLNDEPGMGEGTALIWAAATLWFLVIAIKYGYARLLYWATAR